MILPGKIFWIYKADDILLPANPWIVNVGRLGRGSKHAVAEEDVEQQGGCAAEKFRDN